MLIRYLGHSEFLLTDEHGAKVVTDPYDDHVGYPVQPVACGAVTVSHGHSDHAYTAALKGSPIVLDKKGSYSPLPDVFVTMIPCWHDEVSGAKRGPNLISVIEMDGVRVCHLGDLGHPLTDDLIRQIGRVDVLLVPVGGFFTIDSSTALTVVKALSPRITIPMHYRTECNASWPIAPVDEFLDLMGADEGEREEMDILRVMPQDLCEQPRLALMRRVTVAG